MSAVVATVLLILLTFLFLVGLYFFLRPSKLTDPTSLQATLNTVNSNGMLLYTFTWVDSNPIGTTYVVKILNSSNSTIASGTVITSTTVGKIWSPSTQLTSGSSMVFSVQAKGKHSRVSSNVVTLSFVPSGTPPSNGGGGGTPSSNGGGTPSNGNPPPSGGSKDELFVVGTSGGYLFRGGDSCSADSDCGSSNLRCSESGKCVYTDAAALALSNKVCSSLGASTATTSTLVDEFNNGASWCGYALVDNGDGTVSYQYPTYKPGPGCGLSEQQFPTIQGGASTLNSNILCYGARPASGTTVDVYSTKDGSVVTPWSNNLNGGSMWSMYDTITKPPAYGCSSPGEYCETDPTFKNEVFVISPSTPGINYIVGGSGLGYIPNSTIGQISCNSASDCPYGATCNSSSKCELPTDVTDAEKMYTSMADKVCSNVGAVPATASQVESAFNAGASWCTLGYTVNSDGTLSYGEPTWNTTPGCFAQVGGKPLIYPSSFNLPNNILCYGAKPASGTKVDLFSPGDGLGTTVYDWSDNMQLYSRFDDWNGTYQYGCSTPNSTCS